MSRRHPLQALHVGESSARRMTRILIVPALQDDHMTEANSYSPTRCNAVPCRRPTSG